MGQTFQNPYSKFRKLIYRLTRQLILDNWLAASIAEIGLGFADNSDSGQTIRLDLNRLTRRMVRARSRGNRGYGPIDPPSQGDTGTSQDSFGNP